MRQPEVALLELVKNAYDADSTRCEIRLDGNDGIEIVDNGSGMTLEDFTNGWMRIGTSSKGKLPVSKTYGRPITGEKGIGRFAVRYLGQKLDLTSVAFDPKRNATTRLEATFKWDDLTESGPAGLMGGSIIAWCRAHAIPVGDYSRKLSDDLDEPDLFEFRFSSQAHEAAVQVVDIVRGFDELAGAIRRIHYDYDDRRAAHPVFHAQMKSCADHLSIVNEYYHTQFVLGPDVMTGVARRVRLPTAHMDPLAVFVQLLADHLLNENSGAMERSAFERARTALMFFKSDPRRAERLSEVLADGCFRGPRWYPNHTATPEAAAVPLVAAT